MDIKDKVLNGKGLAELVKKIKEAIAGGVVRQYSITVTGHEPYPIFVLSPNKILENGSATIVLYSENTLFDMIDGIAVTGADYVYSGYLSNSGISTANYIGEIFIANPTSDVNVNITLT